jgi:EmrB/QacA subfamily drug resistance transporter
MQNSPETNGRRKWLVLLAVGIGTFMSALDGSVVNTVLPVVRKSFGSQVATIEWVVVIYLLVVSGLLLTFGRLGDLRGQRRVYLLGFVIFVVGSMLCGLAPTAGLLVAFRGLQALGAAMLFANSPAILTKTFPAEMRGRALGLQATMTYLGLMVGPSLGGWLTQALSWRAVFYINVPVGILALVLSWINVPRDVPETRGERFDLPGALLFMAGLVALLLALNEGADWGWGSPLILGLAAAALVLLAGFVWWERRVTSPMLDLSLFGRPVFTSAALSAIGNYVALYSVLFLLPFYLLQGRGLDPAQAGLLLTAQPLVMAVAAPVSGTLSDRIGSRLPATLGMLILAGGLFLLSQIGAQTPLPMVAAGLAVCGLGTGIFVSPNNSALMGAAPRQRQGIAAGTLATARNVGMVLGIGLSGAILTSFWAGAAIATSAALADPSPSGLFQAMHIGFLVAAAIALAAGVASATRGQG